MLGGNVPFRKTDFTKKKRFTSIFAKKPMGFYFGVIRKKIAAALRCVMGEAALLPLPTGTRCEREGFFAFARNAFHKNLR